MEKEGKKVNYPLWGVFFLVIQILIIIRNYPASHIYLFWFCDFAPLLFAFAFLFRIEQLIKALINFGIISQLIYLIIIMNGVLPLELVYSPAINIMYIIVTVLMHLTGVLALILTYKIKPKIQSIYFSILIIFVVYALTLNFTSAEYNINLVYSQGYLLPTIKILYFTHIWPILAFILLVLPTQGLQYLLYKLALAKKKKNQ